MIDLRLLREKPDYVKEKLSKRGFETEILDKIISKDEKWRELKGKADSLRAEKNKISQNINEAKKQGKDIKPIIAEGERIAKEMENIGKKEEEMKKEIDKILMEIPNLPHESVPEGKDETENKEVRKWGEPKKFSKDVIAHHEIGEKFIDFERGSKLGGHRFTVLKGKIAKLERALANFMLDVQVSNGFSEISVPYLVKTKILEGTGQLPKFAEDLYKTDEDLWLIPTAEVPLTNLHRNEILKEEELPLRYAALTPCFRREAGAYGKDIKGLMRQHQFQKVELASFTTKEESYKELELITKNAERILQLLEIPYRIVELCTGDLGFAAAKTYDIEIWIPSQDKYREVSSCSNCEDFQARRANIKIRRKEMEFAHTLNGSGLAVGRTLIAVIENFQDNEGINIPKVLRDYIKTEKIMWKE
ncbi:serine--tRNA ligase [Candidatus Micrarchaeota archaeon]|nr:serine--tRNA ligase [Candidatus Micrarchaeota archaeon]